MTWFGQLTQDLNPILTILPGLLAAYYTYKLGKKKSKREEWQELYNLQKERAEQAEKARIEAVSESAELRRELEETYQKLGKNKGDC